MAIIQSIEKRQALCSKQLTCNTTMGRSACKGKVSLRKPILADRRSISMDAATSLFRLSKKWNVPFEIRSKNMNLTKKVSFAPMATVLTVPTPTMDDVQQTWYGQDEYRAFELDRRNAIAAIHWAIENDIYLDPDTYTAVGLENYLSREQLYQRRYRLMRHVYNVLVQKQQHLQRECVKTDAKSLYDTRETKLKPFLTQPTTNEDVWQRIYKLSNLTELTNFDAIGSQSLF
jgi:hypothetical protein